MTIRIAVLLALTSVVLSCCCLAAPTGNADARIKLPRGFADVYLGMSLKDFLRVRVNARPFNLFSTDTRVGTKRSSHMFAEDNVKHPLFNSVIYLFRQETLDGVVLHGEHKIQALQTKRQALLTETITLYGMPSALKVADVAEEEVMDKKPVLFWQKGSFIIAAILPSASLPKKATKNGMDLKIGRGQSPDTLIRKYSQLTSAQKEVILAPVRKAIGKLLPGQKITEEKLPFDERQPDSGPIGGTVNHPPAVVIQPQGLQPHPTVPYSRASSNGDRWPLWGRQKSMLILTTPRIGSQNKATAMAKDSQAATDAITLVADGKITALLSVSDTLSYPSWTSDGNRIAFEMQQQIYVLDLQSTTIGQCNDRERVRRNMPSWDPSGKLLAMSGTHSPSDDAGSEDSDIFVSKIAEKLSRVSMETNRCVAHLPGADILPVFSPEGNWIAFAHQEGPPSSDSLTPDKSWSIYRVQPDISYRSKEYEPPQRIIEGLPQPERLGWFPDGKRLLMSYTGNDYEMKNPPDIVDVENKTRHPLELVALRDPDLPQGQPLIVREPVVSPDGKKIAFRALRWSGNPKDDGAIYIYTCNIDGSDLKRITPPISQPPELYQFRQPGITANNIWEKLEPKPNLGTPVKLDEDMPGSAAWLEKQRKKMEKPEKERKKPEQTDKPEPDAPRTE